MTPNGSRLAAVLFADVVGYSDLSSRDEAGALRLIHRFQDLCREKIPRFGGRVVKFMGDGIMAEFPSGRAAVAAAATLREAYDHALHIGIHVGDVESFRGDLLGDGVNVAARLQGLAESGEILVSGAVAFQLRQRKEFAFELRGKRELKGVGEVEVYAASLLEPIEPGEASSPGRGAWSFDTSIAVLPFEALGEADSTFAAGIHGDVLTGLSRVAGIDVISRGSVIRYRDSERSPREIAGELGVAWILGGEVQQAGDQVRVSARLIDAGEERQVWADGYQRKLALENIFDIQREITTEIVGALERRLTPRERRALGGEPTHDLEAYRLWVQGRELLGRRTEESMQRAITHFQRAIERDEGYALAWAGLADAGTLLRAYQYSMPGGLTEPERAARRAVELDAELAEAHVALAGAISISPSLVGQARGEEVQRRLLRAVELQPSYAMAHNFLSIRYQLNGEPEAALESARRAVRLDPLNPEVLANLTMSLLANGDAERALLEARRIRDLGPGYTTGPFYEALAQYHLGRFSEARSLVDGLSVEWAGAGPRATLALSQVALGDAAGARDTLVGIDPAADPFAHGLLRAALGETEEAFELFDGIERWDMWPALAIRYLFPDLLGPVREKAGFSRVIERVQRSQGLKS